MPAIAPVSYSSHDLERINESPIVLTVAGHANHGKTSIIRTFTRNRQFGEVRDEPGVTKEVSFTRLSLHGKTYLKVYDTPGFQFSSLAIETCGETCQYEDISAFFRSDDKYTHDRLALEQVRKSQIILYVVDVSQPPSERLRDDFHVLSKCMVPVLPLFNFIENDAANHEQDWKDCLRRFNYHEFTRYDAHRYEPAYETQLYQRMIEKFEDDPLHRKFLQWRMRESQREEEERVRIARRAVADMLVDCAAYQEAATNVTLDNRKDVEKLVLDAFQKRISEREYEGFKRILEIYSIEPHRLNNKGGQASAEPIWTRDFFGKQSMKDFGMGVSGGAVGGALTGGTIDAFVGGASFGTGALLGALVGGVAGFFGGALYQQEYDKETGIVSIQANRDIWRMLAGRSIALLKDVRHCGAASDIEFEVTTKPPKFTKEQLTDLNRALEEASKQPRFSHIGLTSAQNGDLSPRLQQQRAEKLAAVERWLAANDGLESAAVENAE